MQEKEIKEYIDRLNQNKGKETIFLRQINEYVEVGKVWEKEPTIDDDFSVNIPSWRFFFIKNEIGRYVGAVLDMTHDLHWYILEEERKKGHLNKALRTAILPYLFYDEYDDREVQRISIDEYGIGESNYQNSKKVATRLGFKPVNEEESKFELTIDDFNWEHEHLEEKNNPIPQERLLELRKRVMLSYQELIKVSDELLMAYDNDCSLREIAKKIRYYPSRIKNIKE